MGWNPSFSLLGTCYFLFFCGEVSFFLACILACPSGPIICAQMSLAVRRTGWTPDVSLFFSRHGPCYRSTYAVIWVIIANILYKRSSWLIAAVCKPTRDCEGDKSRRRNIRDTDDAPSHTFGCGTGVTLMGFVDAADAGGVNIETPLRQKA